MERKENINRTEGLIMEHTRGPWIADKSSYKGHDFEGGFLGVIRTKGKGRPTVIYAGPFSFQSLGGRTEEEADANARLIAAAPEMLKLLKWYHKTASKEGRENFHKQIHAVIAKVETTQ